MFRVRDSLKVLGKLTAIACVYCLVFEFFYCWIVFHHPWPPVPPRQAALCYLSNLVPTMLLNAWIYWVVCKGPAAPRRWWLKIARDCVLTAAMLVAINAVAPWFMGVEVEWGGTVFCTVILLLGWETGFFVARLRQSMAREAGAREKLMRYRYDALKAQFNPHFLFNSLNILNALVESEPAKAQRFVVSLARVYRYVLERERDATVSMACEMDFLMHYIRILKIRYSDNFVARITVDPRAEACRVIPCTLQLLMENVTKHNVISAEHPMTIDITADCGGLVVSNTVCRKPSAAEGEERTGFGMRYLSGLYGCYGVQIDCREHDGVYTVHVPFI